MLKRVLGVATVAWVLSVGASAAPAPGLKTMDPPALEARVAALSAKIKLPGALVLLMTPQGNVVFGYGTTELGTTLPPRADTHFRAASNTKTMTGVVIVQMVQEGRLHFDDKIETYVAGVPRGSEISIRQLLTMRSGLFNFTDAPELAKSLDDDPDKVWTAAEVLGMAFKRPADFAPGAEYAYNNTNYYLLGLVAEKIDGKPLAAVFQDRLFGPLGMKNTLLPVPASNAIPTPYAHGYLYGSTSFALADAPYPAALIATAEAGTLKPNDDTAQNPSAYFAAGGVISTADDLAVWMRALVGGKLLDADFQKQWLASPEAPVPGEASMLKYGYGILTLGWGPNVMYYHQGEMPGYQSFMGHDPVNDVTLVIWTNLTLDLAGRTTANSLMIAVLDEIYAVSPLAPAK